ncbi:MAG: prephenate dehydrogenase/arogenate dehydrogenase family protein [Planctomycetota bacterium]
MSKPLPHSDGLPQRPDWLQRVTVIGVGLLGGSLGLSLRRNGVYVKGCCRSDSSCNDAIQFGTVDEASTDIASACRDSQIVVIAAPVTKIAELAVAAKPHLQEGAIITDVGSTKTRILNEIRTLTPDLGSRFVAAHPIAGSEKSGCQNASATLFDQKTIVLTPDAENDDRSVGRAEEFWLQTGGRVVHMSAEDHDQRLACVSHVPHLIASALTLLPEESSHVLVGSGWADMTRVASGDPELWTAICEHNRSPILQQLDRLMAELVELRGRVEQAETGSLRTWLADAKRIKDQVGD